MRKLIKLTHRIKCQNQYQDLLNAPNVLFKGPVEVHELDSKVSLYEEKRAESYEAGPSYLVFKDTLIFTHLSVLEFLKESPLWEMREFFKKS